MILKKIIFNYFRILNTKELFIRIHNFLIRRSSIRARKAFMNKFDLH